MNAVLLRHNRAKSSGIHRHAATAVAVLIAAAAGATEPEAVEPPKQEPTPAVWKWREADFFYRSNVALYSCDAMKARVISILRAVGGRDDMTVRVDNCDPFMTPPDPLTNTWRNVPSSSHLNNQRNREQVVHVRVKVLMPVEMTPEIIEEIQRDKSRRDLISRVTGNPAASQNDPIMFHARRESVTLSRKTIGLDAIECELIDQMASSVLPKLDVRVVRRNISCSRDGTSRIPPQLTVEALVGVTYGATELPKIEDDPAPAAPESTGTEPPAETPADPKPSGLMPVSAMR